MSDKSAAEYQRLWNKYYRDAAIASREITRIKEEEWYDFFWKLVCENHLTKKQFKQVAIVANVIVSYCVHSRILYTSPIRDIIANGDFPYARSASYNQIKARPLTEKQIEKIREWCGRQIENPRTHKVYPYAILINMRLGLRIGELRGLTWDDVDLKEGNIHVSKQVVNTYKMHADGDCFEFEYAGHSEIDHLKAYENERDIPIGPDVIGLLQNLKDLKLSETEVFPMRYHTYNDKIKDAAVYAGVADLHQIRTHSLRTTAASNVYAKCHDIKTVQAFLGHTTPEMTAKYIKGQDSYNSLKGLV